MASSSSSPDCVIVNEYPTSHSSSPDSETSSSSGVDVSGKTVSSFHVPEPPGDVSVLFVDEVNEVDDYHENSDEEQGLIKNCQLNTRVEEVRRGMAELKVSASPVLHSPDDFCNNGRDEEGESPSHEEEKSDSFSSSLDKASPILLYSCSSGEEGENEKNASLLGKGKLDSFSSLSSEASPTVLYHHSSGGEEGKERSASIGKVNSDSALSLTSEASGSSLRRSSEGDLKDTQEEVNTSQERIAHDDQTLSSSASQHLATCSSGEEQESKATASPPVNQSGRDDDPKPVNQSGHSSEVGRDGDPKSKAVGNGGSIGMTKGNGGEEKGGASKEKEKQRKVEEKEDERNAKPEPQFKVGYQYRTVEKQLMQNEVSCTHNLPCKLQVLQSR